MTDSPGEASSLLAVLDGWWGVSILPVLVDHLLRLAARVGGRRAAAS